MIREGGQPAARKSARAASRPPENQYAATSKQELWLSS